MTISKLMLNNNEYDLSGESKGNTSFSVADNTLFIESSGYSNYSEPTLYEGKELDKFTWADLKQKCVDGDFAGIRVGDYKIINTFGYTNRMYIAGIDTYYSPLNTGATMTSHHIDWIGEYLSPVYAPWTVSRPNNNGNEYPYLSSYWYNINMVTNLPSEVQAVISYKYAPAEKRYGVDSNGETIIISNSNGMDICNYSGGNNKLWLPTENEVFGFTAFGTPGYSATGTQYPIFRNNPTFKIKTTKSQDQAQWWLATVAADSTTKACAVSCFGQPITSNCSAQVSDYDLNYFPICFTISGE